MMIGHRYPIVCEEFIIPPQSDCISIIHCQIFIYICSLIPVNTTASDGKRKHSSLDQVSPLEANYFYSYSHSIFQNNVLWCGPTRTISSFADSKKKKMPTLDFFDMWS
jgi:hypothetical protein